MRNILAMMRITVSHAVRLNVAVLFIMLLVVLLPVMSVIMTGDGTLKGKVQAFTSYSLSLTSLILCLLTIILSGYSLTDDFRRRYLFMVLSKPIARWQIVCGKFLGVLLINLVLLVCFCGIIVLLTYMIPVFVKAPPAERMQLEEEFLTARKVMTDPVDTQRVKERVLSRYAELREKNQLPQDMSEQKILQALRAEELGKERNVAPGERKVWEFSGVPVARDPNEVIYIKFKYDLASDAPDGRVHSVWFIGDLRQEAEGPGTTFKNPVYVLERSDKHRTVMQFGVPANAVAPDGYLAIGLFNPYINQTTMGPRDVKLLVSDASFVGNISRAALMLFTRLVFLTAVGIFASTWLSFPTCLLIGLTFYFVGSINSFIVESLQYFGENPSEIYQAVVQFFINLLPRFDGTHSPTNAIVAGELIPLALLGRMVLTAVFIKSALLLALGVLIFNKREVAKITV